MRAATWNHSGKRDTASQDLSDTQGRVWSAKTPRLVVGRASERLGATVHGVLADDRSV